MFKTNCDIYKGQPLKLHSRIMRMKLILLIPKDCYIKIT